MWNYCLGKCGRKVDGWWRLALIFVRNAYGFLAVIWFFKFIFNILENGFLPEAVGAVKVVRLVKESKEDERKRRKKSYFAPIACWQMLAVARSFMLVVKYLIIFVSVCKWKIVPIPML